MFLPIYNMKCGYILIVVKFTILQKCCYASRVAQDNHAKGDTRGGYFICRIPFCQKYSVFIFGFGGLNVFFFFGFLCL